jgi:hypothetical protein
MAEEVTEEEPKFYYCESCGKRLFRAEDHGNNDMNNLWCKDCCNPDGSHKSRDEAKKVVMKLLLSPDAVRSMGERLDKEEAEKLAEEYMKRMPAWSGETK